MTHFIVHSRKCLLKGLSPAQNRTVPPLRYGWVFALKRDFPHLQFSLNGGIQTSEEVNEVLRHRVAGAEVRVGGSAAGAGRLWCQRQGLDGRRREAGRVLLRVDRGWCGRSAGEG